MTIRQLLTTCIGVILLVSPASWAQEAAVETAPPPAKLPPAEPVLNHIPADAAGFVVVNNIQATITSAEEFLSGIVPPGMMPPILPLLVSQAMLGEGFNPDGGFAVVLLDPGKFGLDLAVMAGLKSPDPNAPPAEGAKIPFILMVPGKSIADVFGAYQMTEAGAYTKVSLRMGEMYAGKIGGYICLSPEAKPLDAIAASGAKIGGALPKADAELIARADIAAHVNMKVLGPIADDLMKAIEAQVSAMGEMSDAMNGHGGPKVTVMGPMAAIAPALPVYREIISQLDSITISARAAKTGLVVEAAVSMDPDSVFGKVFAAQTPPTAPLLAGLPNLPYVLAVGSASDVTGKAAEELAEFNKAMTDKMFSNPLFSQMFSPEMMEKLQTLSIDWDKQVTSMKIVAGGAPTGSGVFGAAMVVKCKDSAATKAMVIDLAEVYEELFRTMMDMDGGNLSDAEAEEAETDGLRLVHAAGAETSPGVSIDTITLTLPQMAEMDDEDIAQMTRMLGEAAIRIRLGATDENTVVVTFGGAKAFFDETVKSAAAGTSTIVTGAGEIEALKHMPSKPSAIVLINVGNLFEVINTGWRIMVANENSEDTEDAGDPESAPALGTGPLPFNITSRIPITIGVAVSGPSARMALYVPKELIAETVQGFMGMMMAPPGGMPPMGPEDEPIPSGEDF